MMLFMPYEIELGMNFIEILKNGMRPEGIKETTEVFKKVFKGKAQVIEGVLHIKNHNYWFETFLNSIPDTEGKTIEISCVSHNITEKKQNNKELLNSLREKEVLLKEVHHRVKNNLQVVSSILNLQTSHIKDEKVLSVLDESQNRIKSMSLIHENLYQTNDFAFVNFTEYIKNLVKNLIHSYRVYDIKINYEFDFKDIKLDLDHAIPCGLIVNEIVSNTLKYAFVGRSEGTVFLSIKKEKNKFYLEIGDDGIGLPKEIDIENTETLGLQLVCSLVEQINGTMKLKEGKGTRYLIIFES
jgi:two-component sensor histidine kinase